MTDKGTETVRVNRLTLEQGMKVNQDLILSELLLKVFCVKLCAVKHLMVPLCIEILI